MTSALHQPGRVAGESGVFIAAREDLDWPADHRRSPYTSISPLRTPAAKAAHCARVNSNTGPVGSFESRTPTAPSAATATSTQLSPASLREDLRQRVNFSFAITVISCFAGEVLGHSGEEIKAIARRQGRVA